MTLLPMTTDGQAAKTRSLLDANDANKQGQEQSLLKDRASGNQSSNQMELPVNNGDDSKMDTNDDVSEPLSYDMSFDDSSPPDNR